MYLMSEMGQNSVERLIVRMKNDNIKTSDYIHDDEHYYKIIRKNVKKFRNEKNLTQQDLADMTDLSREYICDIENEKRCKHPSIAVVGRIADALNIDIENFLKK